MKKCFEWNERNKLDFLNDFLWEYSKLVENDEKYMKFYQLDFIIDL